MQITLQTVRGAVYGAAAGDAVGVPYEFTSRDKMRLEPAADMIGGGTYSQPPGTWSDDTSMILCTLDKLDETQNFDAVMQAFSAWSNHGEYTPYGECFDIGSTTWSAIRQYERSGSLRYCGLVDEKSNGNGSLMRIIPAALYAEAHGLSDGQAAELSHTLSALTHAHRRSKIGCGIFTYAACALIRSPDPSAVADGLAQAQAFYYNYPNEKFAAELTHYERIFRDNFAQLPEEEIRSSGYVVTTLECALWCLLNTDNYRDCILKAVNFGKDTDTAACVAGALAGLLYGYEGIPSDWRSRLARADLIDAIIGEFCERNAIK